MREATAFDTARTQFINHIENDTESNQESELLSLQSEYDIEQQRTPARQQIEDTLQLNSMILSAISLNL